MSEDALAELRTEYTEKVAKCLGRSVEAFIEAGKLLTQAKEAMPYGSFGMVLRDLGLDDRKAQKLMRIAGNPVLANPSHVTVLPASYTALDILAGVEPAKLVRWIREKKITPGLQRDEATFLVNESKRRCKTRKRIEGIAARRPHVPEPW